MPVDRAIQETKKTGGEKTMPRILSDEPCEVTFDDNIAGGKIKIRYRMPTTEERIKYSNSQVNRSGRKLESIIGDTRQKFGKIILAGITDGDFMTAGNKPLSSNEGSPHYDAGWKEIVAKYAPDVIAMLAMHVFENALILGDGNDEQEDEDPT
jgi:hypothetical protein